MIEWAEETKKLSQRIDKKVGSAKASAMEAIIMLLDNNTLNGTLCAMKRDAQKAARLSIDKDVMAQIIRSASNVAAGFAPQKKMDTQEVEQ